MTEREWTLIVQKYLSASIAHDKKLAVKAFERIPYALCWGIVTREMIASV